MLQQTQVERVAKKYTEFIAAFPDFQSLARAPLRKVLAVWSGMGYNRRALALKRIAAKVVRKYGGRLPSDAAALCSLSGIGCATAASVSAFAFNKPTVFVETNIRSVFIHFFFRRRRRVDDTEIVPLVAQTLDTRNPRKWYSALMDYGTMLKQLHGNPGRKSAHYRTQKPFKGSRRQMRGMILKAFVFRPRLSVDEIAFATGVARKGLSGALHELQRDGLVRERRGRYQIA
ncbi:MAG: A/G-specific adenine glycosylase [Candidatus Aureabacteria bacterium]|nr:A/G-specific adenine glycosylase [Candidatus Auribacterota bacterium]